jgi:hypothetical protein
METISEQITEMDFLNRVLLPDMPSYEEVREPLATASRHQALSASFTSLSFAALQVFVLPTGMEFAGTIQVNGWDMGRPSRRLRRMRSGQRALLMDLFIQKVKKDIENILVPVYMRDTERERAWIIAMNITDPVTLIEANRDNADKCSNHLACVYIDGNFVSVIDPLQSASPVKTILNAVSEGVVQALQGLTHQDHFIRLSRDLGLPPVLQTITEHTCVLWCLWITFHLVCNEKLDESRFYLVCGDKLDKVRESFAVSTEYRHDDLREFVPIVQRAMISLLMRMQTLRNRLQPVN